MDDNLPNGLQAFALFDAFKGDHEIPCVMKDNCRWSGLEAFALLRL